MISDRVERILSLVLTIAAVIVALAVVRREFFATPPGTGSARSVPQKVDDWEQVLPDSRLVGNPNAAVKVIEFIDLECSACRHFHATVRSLKDKYPRDVAFAFVHYPLPYHRFARPAARAAECAHAMGKFFEMVSVIYDKQDSLGLTPFVGMARSAGISDSMRYGACMKDTSRMAAVEAGLAAGVAVGVTGTPTVIVNGMRYDAPPSESQMDEIIADLLKRSR